MENENEYEILLIFSFEGKFYEKGNEVGKWMTHPTVTMISRIVLIVTSGSLRYKRVFIFAGIQFPFLGGLIVIHDVPTGALAF